MPGPKTRRNISRVIPICMIWVGSSLIYSVLEKGLLGPLQYYPSTGNPYDFKWSILVTGATALVIGLLVGTTEVLYLHKLFNRNNLLTKIVCKTAIYLIITIAFLLITALISNAAVYGGSLFDYQVWNNVRAFLLSFSFLSVEIYIAAIIGLCLFYTEVSDNLGQGVLNNFFTGKYHKPKIEERIFMFVDMKSSTTIAESIGHVQYFEMLKDYFAHLSGPIVDFAGEIYQYVGDEVIVSWRLKSGLRNNNCIRCFYAMQAALENAGNIHKERFGVLPGFKAGIHVGQVTTGEIGTIKKEIVFSGDVLNTTSRIQGLCNSFDVELLISGQLIELLKLDAQYKIIDLAEHRLKGRDESIKLFTLELVSNILEFKV
jgi:adenylate cyclase